MAKQSRPKPKRGRLSSIDLLPDEAMPFVREAIEGLKTRDHTQDELRETLNNHLLSIGCDPISKSAFNRKALQIAATGRELLRAREIASVMAEKLNDAPDGDVGLLLNETIKALVYDVVMEQSLSDESVSIDMLRKSSDALMRLEKARQMSIDSEIKRREKFAKQADEAVTKAAEKAGLSKDQVAQIRRDVLGVVKKQ